MGWESMVDGLTKKYPGKFRVPFTTFRDIFRKIEEKYIIKEWTQYLYTNWRGNVKKEVHLKTFPWAELDNEISKLDSASNYWIVIVFGDDQRGSQYIYDCHIESMKYLINYASRDFFIIDKRYNWLTFFKIDPDSKDILLSKSGDTQTPFEKE